MAANDEIMRLDMVEQSTMQAILEAPTLPKVSSSDNGKLLGVSSGKWKAVSAPTGLPEIPSSNGTYHLGLEVDDEVATLSWVSEEAAVS